MKKEFYINNVTIIDDPKEPKNNGKKVTLVCGPTLYNFIHKELSARGQIGKVARLKNENSVSSSLT